MPYIVSLLIIIIVGLSGCDRLGLSSEQDTPAARPTATLSEEIERHLAKARNTVNTMTPSRTEIEKKTSEEAVKLQALEYHVAEFPQDIEAADLQRELTIIGRDRWDCSEPILTPSQNLRFICKRRPKSYLRFLPHVLGLGLTEFATGVDE